MGDQLLSNLLPSVPSVAQTVSPWAIPGPKTENSTTTQNAGNNAPTEGTRTTQGADTSAPTENMEGGATEQGTEENASRAPTTLGSKIAGAFKSASLFRMLNHARGRLFNSKKPLPVQHTGQESG